MNKTLKIILSWFLVLSWMGVIYYLSDMSGDESTNKSEGAINLVIKKTLETTNEIGITKTNPNSQKVTVITDKLNYPMRKLMHASVYFVLTLFLINAFYQSGIKNKKMLIFSIIICFLYACSDEFHQSFTERTASFKDVLIDTFGGLISILLVKIISVIRNKKYLVFMK